MTKIESRDGFRTDSGFVEVLDKTKIRKTDGTSLNLVDTEDMQSYALPIVGGTLTGTVKHSPHTTTPTGSSPSATIDLNTTNHPILDTRSASGTIALTLTIPTGTDPATGTILVLIHATTAVGLTITLSSGTKYWFASEPTWTGLAVGKRIGIAWHFDGTDMNFFPSAVSA